MTKNYNLHYWEQICESFEAMNSVLGAEKTVELPFNISEWDGLGNYYMQVTSKEYKSKNGQFFTPKPVVEYLMKSAGYEVGKTVADISCGSGRFLLGVLEKLTSEEKSLEEIKSTVFGFDIDPALARITLANIRSFLAQKGYKIQKDTHFNILVQNSLENVGSLFGKEYKFDCILGNPPYLKTSPKNNLGHPNLYASFIEAGIYFLKKGGTLGFIIPKSFVSGAYFSKLRNILSKEVKTKEVVTLYERDKAFGDVLQEQVLLTIENTAPDFTDIEVGTAFTNGKFTIEKFFTAYDTVFWEDDIMCIPSNKIDEKLVKKCFKNGFQKIKNSGLRVSTGQVVAYRRKQFFGEKTDKNHYPLYWSHNISSAH